MRPRESIEDLINGEIPPTEQIKESVFYEILLDIRELLGEIEARTQNLGQ